ncbi:poly [ADP-ribose] polymerase 2 [Amia ocellicauda]|uniref:poly [ADP-ribose] polymerase 2 n=1 Tax=Amia ocellicauda TaxID=2972642 RepID=UPI003463A403
MPRTRSTRSKSEHASDNEQHEEKPGCVWQWQDDDGGWQLYPPAVSAQLSAAQEASRATVSVVVGSGRYTVDLRKMRQTNRSSKYSRAVRLLQPDTDGDAAIDPATQDTEPASVKQEPEEDQPIAKKRRKDQGQKAGPSEGPSNDSTDSKEVVKTVVMKGKAPVDTECRAKLGKAHVYCEGDDIYDVMLNQTNLQFNNNKYYLIQLLQDDGAQSYSVWMRWGRVGKVGQSTLVSYGGDLSKAKDVFMKKFLDKTKNEWHNRSRFEKVAGKYDIVQMDYSTNDKEEEKPGAQVAVQRQECRLDKRVQNLLELICDLKAMEECVLEMKFDIKKAPLGKLTVEQIRAGYAALKRIEECLSSTSSTRELLEACNQFYTRIPHDFGLRTPPLIRTKEELKEKIALLEALGDIQIAVKMVQSSVSSAEHPLDRQYQSLHCNLQPLDHSSSQYTLLEKYLQSTHASTHNDYSMTVLDIFAVDREGETEAFTHDLHNRTLLWHGSRLSNWVGILSKGLRVAPPEAPVTGYMFGKGIYFADMASKSANYCFANQKNNIGLLMLSEVALGDSNELLNADYDADRLPSGKHSTKGLGQTAPDPKNSITFDGASVPMGPAVSTGVVNKAGYTLLYNEFIVYNPNQVRIRYLLRVRFNYSALW